MARVTLAPPESILVNRRKEKVRGLAYSSYYLHGVSYIYFQIFFFLKTSLQERVAKHARDRGIVLIKLNDLSRPSEQGTILTERQKEWVQTSSYNSTMHNPVLYK